MLVIHNWTKLQLIPQVDLTHSITYIRAKKCICQQISKALKTITTAQKITGIRFLIA